MNLRVLLLTNEYPPNFYGGAGVHVEYLSRELAKLTPVEVRTFGTEDLQQGRPTGPGVSGRYHSACCNASRSGLAAQSTAYLPGVYRAGDQR